MKSIDNLKQRINPRNRLIIAVMLFVLFIVLFAFFKMFSKKDNEALDRVAGSAKVASAPSKNDISAPQPGDKQMLPEDSPVNEGIEKDRQRQIEESKKTGGGFMDRLTFENANEVVKKNAEDELSNQQSVVGLKGTEQSNSAMIEAERQRLRNEQTARNLPLASGGKQKPAAASVDQGEKNIDAYLDAVIERAKGNVEIGSYVKTLTVETQSGIYVPRSGNQPNETSVAQEAVVDSSTNSGNLPRVSDYIGSAGIRKQASAPIDNVVPVRTSYEEIVDPAGSFSEAPKTTINVGEMFYGILQIGINTDEIGPIRVFIPGSNKIPGAVLVGEPVRSGEKAMITLKNMSVKGNDIGINAVVLNPDTLRPGLADGVDRHTFERYFKLAVAAAADGYVDALQGTSRRTYSDGSSETISDRLPNSADQAAVALGRVGEVLIPKFERDFDRPPTVSVDSNRDVIVMFMSSAEI